MSNIELNVNDVPQWNKLATDEYDVDFIEEYNKKISDDSIKDADTMNVQDEYVNMELGIPRGPDGGLECIKVKKRALDIDGIHIGKANKNPIFYTRAYEVEHKDGTTEVMPANTITECILSQVNEEGHKELLFEEIVDHRHDAEAVGINSNNNVTSGYKTTKG